jgi:hypothetical protein
MFDKKIFISVVLILLQSFLVETSAQSAFSGYTLYNPLGSYTAYLIDMDGNIAHSWACNCSVSDNVYLLEDGTLLRCGRYNNIYLNGAAAGGRIQKIDWNGNLIWDYIYSTTNVCQHHDIEAMPNGNVLLIAWEKKTASEAKIAGSENTQEIWPLHIVEVEQTGTATGNIVWEWHLWDHLVQDYDQTKENYGVVTDHPELMNINFFGDKKSSGYDWLHTNAINYNEELDQIVISSHTLNEFYIIDHSTTTEEAAVHTGGDRGMGGDFLYRWGNPQAYNCGSSSDKKFYVCHDSQWIADGLEGEGNILIFNNGEGRPGGNASSIEEIIPPTDAFGNYLINPGSAFGPENQSWEYFTPHFALHLSGAQRLPNGNTLICEGPLGNLIEISPDEDIVWEFNIGGSCTRAYRYAPDYSGLSQLSINELNVPDFNFDIYPNPTNGVFSVDIDILENSNCEIVIFNTLGVIIKNVTNLNTIDLSQFEKGVYIVNIEFTIYNKKVCRNKLLIKN